MGLVLLLVLSLKCLEGRSVAARLGLRVLDHQPGPLVRLRRESSSDPRRLEVEVDSQIAWCAADSQTADRCTALEDLAVCWWPPVGGERPRCRPVRSALEDGLTLAVPAAEIVSQLLHLPAMAWLDRPWSDSLQLDEDQDTWPTATAPIKPATLDLSPSDEVDFGRQLRIKHTRHGWLLFDATDYPTGQSLDRLGEWEEPVVRLLCSFLDPGDFAIDVGAHVGSVTLPLAHAVGPAGKVLALEPQLPLHQVLHANLALNHLTNVVGLRVAAGDAARTHAPEPIPQSQVQEEKREGHVRNWGSFSLDSPTMWSYGELPLDQLLPVNSPCPKLIKVDVEGHEANVLRGAAGALVRCRPLLYLENQCRDSSQRLIDTVLGLGYTAFWDPTTYFARDNHFGQAGPPPDFAGRVSLNMIAVHQENHAALLGDLPAQLTQVDASRPLIEQYNPFVAFRDDAGLPTEQAAPLLAMASC